MNGPPLQPPDPPAPSREQVQLGSRVLELDREQAVAVRQAFQDLANTYGASIEQERRRVLESLGTPGWQPPSPQEVPLPGGLEVPDPDLLFSNKDAWADAFARNLEQRIARNALEQTHLVQGAVASVDQELRRRDQKAQAQAIHDEAMEAMLERRELGDNRRIVQTIYNEQYWNLQHLPLPDALDQIGALAEEEIARIRGDQPVARAEAELEAPAPPPPMLRSSRRASGGAAAAPPQVRTLSDLIRHRQAIALGTVKAA